jgi:hypothetical protein
LPGRQHGDLPSSLSPQRPGSGGGGGRANTAEHYPCYRAPMDWCWYASQMSALDMSAFTWLVATWSRGRSSAFTFTQDPLYCSPTTWPWTLFYPCIVTSATSLFYAIRSHVELIDCLIANEACKPARLQLPRRTSFRPHDIAAYTPFIISLFTSSLLLLIANIVVALSARAWSRNSPGSANRAEHSTQKQLHSILLHLPCYRHRPRNQLRATLRDSSRSPAIPTLPYLRPAHQFSQALRLCLHLQTPGRRCRIPCSSVS